MVGHKTVKVLKTLERKLEITHIHTNTNKLSMLLGGGGIYTEI